MDKDRVVGLNDLPCCELERRSSHHKGGCGLAFSSFLRNPVDAGSIGGTSKNTASARPADQIQRISLNLTTGSGCDGALGVF
jgi:hypothetical protein